MSIPDLSGSVHRRVPADIRPECKLKTNVLRRGLKRRGQKTLAKEKMKSSVFSRCLIHGGACPLR